MGGSATSIAATLAGDPGGLAACIEELRAARGRPGPVLVVIDQAEEPLTLAGQASGRGSCGCWSARWRATSSCGPCLSCGRIPTSFLATAHARLFRDPVTVGALSRTALFEVIAGPAAQAGLRFDPPELVPLTLDEAGGGEALPLLAFTLQELYLDAGRSRVVTGSDYRRMHGVTGALRRQADRVTAGSRAAVPDSPVTNPVQVRCLHRWRALRGGRRGPAPLIFPSAGSRTRLCPPACW